MQTELGALLLSPPSRWAAQRTGVGSVPVTDAQVDMLLPDMAPLPDMSLSDAERSSMLEWPTISTKT